MELGPFAHGARDHRLDGKDATDPVVEGLAADPLLVDVDLLAGKRFVHSEASLGAVDPDVSQGEDPRVLAR